MKNSCKLFDAIDERIRRDGEDGDIAFFNALLLKFEYLTKIIVLAIVACIDEDNDRNRYSLQHRLVHRNSLGIWVEVLEDALKGQRAQPFSAGALPLARDLNERVGKSDWRHTAVSQLVNAAKVLNAEHEIGDRVTLRRFFNIGVSIRNRTRGHGAQTGTQCGSAGKHLKAAIDAIIQNSSLFDLTWVHLHRNLSGKYKVSSLLNGSKPFDYLKREKDVSLPDGVYFQLKEESGKSGHIHVPLIITDRELTDIWLPNGQYKKNSFELLSYVSNNTKRHETHEWSSSPHRLPSSETEGMDSLEQIGDTFSNVPTMRSGYIQRVELEEQLGRQLLTKDRHPIVTLTGPGGIGKTTLAIKTIRDMATEPEPPYEVILWISARDIDLLDAGPKSVARRVFTQRDIADFAVQLLGPDEAKLEGFKSKEYFQDCLFQGPTGPTLFVLDNFETLKDPLDVFEWLDTYVRPPNKVLITTRFRDFKSDYPIEIKGMSDEEAGKLIDGHATKLGISHLITAKYKRQLRDVAEGHPYVIKILLGEVHKEGRALKPKRIVAAADRQLDALFKRTYDALSPGAQRVFLLLSSSREYVPEVAVEAVAFRPGTTHFDVQNALQEAVRYSLVDDIPAGDADERFVGVPLAAAIFGKGELEVSPLKVSVEQDLVLLKDFGPGRRSATSRGTLPRIENLIRRVTDRASQAPEALENDLPVLEYLSSRFPRVYLQLADLVVDLQEDTEKAKDYIRQFLKKADLSEKSLGWEHLAELCRGDEDVKGEVHALCEIALLPTSDLRTLSNVANQLNSRIRELKNKRVEDARSAEVQELLNRVIQKLQRQRNRLTATDCSRLAWLYLNVGDKENARDAAKDGLSKDPDSIYCQDLVKKLRG